MNPYDKVRQKLESCIDAKEANKILINLLRREVKVK